MRRRYVETPAGDRWIVERRWILSPPGWRGFRFGRAPRSERVEPAIVVRQEDDQGAGHYRRPRSVTGEVVEAAAEALWWTNWGSVGGRTTGEVLGAGSDVIGQASGSVAREASGLIGRGGSGTVSRGSGGGGGDGFEFGDLFDADNPVAIVLAVAAAAAALVAAVVLVLPGVVFALEGVAFGAIVGGSIAWRSVTGRPWIVEAREDRPAPRGIAWEVQGWRASAATIDDVVADLQRGDRPDPTDTPAVQARVIEATSQGSDPTRQINPGDATATW